MVDGCLLPEEIVADILLKLPAKALLKFKIVSKEWRSLISSNYFKHRYNKKSLRNPNLILHSQDYTNIRDQKPLLTTVGLAGDVLDEWDLGSVGFQFSKMLPSPSESDNLVSFFVDSERFVVCNLSTRQTICLPEPYTDNSIFIQLISTVGLGYIPSRNRYTIIMNATGPRNWQMITFSKDVSARNGLYVDKWKPIKDIAPYDVHGLPCGVFANGIFYWTIFADPHWLLMCFDLCEENFFTVSLPDEITNRVSGYYLLFEVNGYLRIMYLPDAITNCVSNGYYSLLELNGNLRLMYWKADQQNIEMWKLDDVRNQRWTKQYICATGFQRSLGTHFKPMMVDEDGKMMVYNGGFLEWYSLQDGVFRIGLRGHKRIPGSEDALDFNLGVDLLPL